MSQEIMFDSAFPDLAEIQRDSFKYFLLEGLGEVLDSFPIIIDPTGKLELQFFGQDYKLKFPRYSVRKAKSRDRTYSVQIYIPSKLTRRDTELIKKKKNNKKFNLLDNRRDKNKKYKKRPVFIGDLPLMTNRGTFIISGNRENYY